MLSSPASAYAKQLDKLPARKSSLPKKCSPNQLIGFYGEHNPYGFMSNFYQCIIKVPTKVFDNPDLVKEFGDSITFNNSEQLFMFWKGVVFYKRNAKYNLDIMKNIVLATTPNKAKSLGRKLDCRNLDNNKPFDDVTWNNECCKCMYNACWFKFSQNLALNKLLKATGNKYLTEATSRDKIWGCGINIGDPKLYTPDVWPGTNLLGEVLMVVRDNL